MTTMTSLESEALVEPCFKRLASALDAERERIYSAKLELEQERQSTTSELDVIRREMEEWCFTEKRKIESEWRRLDRIAERMRTFWPDGKTAEIIQINCSGTRHCIPRSTLCSLPDSHLARMFSDDFIQEIPRDGNGRFFLDFNPQCFAIIIEYLQNHRLNPDVPIPVVPAEQQQNMDMLAQALKLKPFLRDNRVNQAHTTSLHVRGNTITATHPGWQVVTSEHPLPVAHPSYFEVQIVSNPDGKGGLAVGVGSRVPIGVEVHSIRQANSILYNSGNGLLGDSFEDENVVKGVQLAQGSTFGVRFEPSTSTVSFFKDRASIGTAKIKQAKVPEMRTLYAVFALYMPEQQLEVDFAAKMPFPYLSIAQPAG